MDCLILSAGIIAKEPFALLRYIAFSQTRRTYETYFLEFVVAFNNPLYG